MIHFGRERREENQRWNYDIGKETFELSLEREVQEEEKT